MPNADGSNELHHLNWEELNDRLRDALDEGDHLRFLEVAAVVKGFVDYVFLEGGVSTAREWGHTWEQIGAALGMTRSQAWQRYHTDSDTHGAAEQLWKAQLKLISAERDQRLAQAEADALSGNASEQLAEVTARIKKEMASRSVDLLLSHFIERNNERIAIRREVALDPDTNQKEQS